MQPALTDKDTLALLGSHKQSLSFVLIESKFIDNTPRPLFISRAAPRRAKPSESQATLLGSTRRDSLKPT